MRVRKIATDEGEEDMLGKSVEEVVGEDRPGWDSIPEIKRKSDPKSFARGNIINIRVVSMLGGGAGVGWILKVDEAVKKDASDLVWQLKTDGFQAEARESEINSLPFSRMSITVPVRITISQEMAAAGGGYDAIRTKFWNETADKFGISMP